MTGEFQDPDELWTLREKAFAAVEENAARYASQSWALDVYIDEPLFASHISQYSQMEDMTGLLKQRAENPDSVVLLPHQLNKLRARAAYHGAGLGAEDDKNIPDSVHARLWNNLENFPALEVEAYEQLCIPWAYKFAPTVLRSILEYDFKIAAEDDAGGDLHLLSVEIEDEESGILSFETETDEDDWDYDDIDDEPWGEPGDYLEEALLSYKPGTVSAEDVVHSAFLRAGYAPPFDTLWVNDMARVVQDMIDGDNQV